MFLDLLSGHIFFPLKIFKTENYQRRSSCSHPRRKARGSHSGRDKRRWKFSRTVAVERDTGMPLKANQFCESLECLSLIAPNRRPASIALLSWSFYTKPIWDKQLNESWNWFAKSSIPWALPPVLKIFRRLFADLTDSPWVSDDGWRPTELSLLLKFQFVLRDNNNNANLIFNSF